jgi:hypothetical protein
MPPDASDFVCFAAAWMVLSVAIIMMRVLVTIGVIMAALGASAAARPDVHVTIAAAPDPSALDAGAVRRALAAELADAPDAAIDAAASLRVVRVGGYVEVSAKLDVVISDATGKMSSVVCGTARARVRRAAYRRALHDQVVADAIASVARRLRARR